MDNPSFIRRWGALIVLSLAMFIIVIDTTIMNVSISALVEEFDTTVTMIQSTITLYALVMAAFLITGGKLGDIWGRKKTFFVGLILYGIGSFTASISPTIGVLILGWSIIEGLGGALMLPNIQTLLRNNYDKKTLPFCYGVLGAVMAGGVALGPVIGGYLTTMYSWRWAFRLEVLVVIIVLATLFLVKDSKLAKIKPKLDIAGVALSATGLAFLVFGFIQAGTYGWFWAKKPYTIGNLEIAPFGLSITVVCIFISAVILSIFVYWQKRRERRNETPLIRLSMLKNKYFTAGITVALIQSFVQAGLLFCIPLLLQIVLGYDALQTGLILLPFSIAILITSIGSSNLGAKISPKYLIQIGLALSIIGFFILINSIHSEIIGKNLWPGFIVIGLGLGFIVAQLVNLILSSVKPKETNEASGVTSTFQQLGVSLGTAVIGAILISTLSFGAQSGIEESTVLNDDQKVATSSAIEENIQFVSDQQLQEVLVEAPEEASDEIIRINDGARIVAIKAALFGIIIFAGLGLVVALYLPKKKLG
jgi:EmrB/QacA subfamily drug resistance transporter